MSFHVEIKDSASRAIAAVHEQFSSPAQRRELMDVIGRRAGAELKAYYLRKDAQSPNKHGWPRQHFWSRISAAANYDSAKTTESTATVVVADPALSAKIKGATIRATGAISPATGKPTRNIAIPLQGAVYGQWPRGNPVPGLFFIRKTDGNGGFLVSRDGKGLIFWYRLLPEVTVPKDPSALPPLGPLGAALAEAAQDFFRRASGGRTGGEN